MSEYLALEAKLRKLNSQLDAQKEKVFQEADDLFRGQLSKTSNLKESSRPSSSKKNSNGSTPREKLSTVSTPREKAMEVPTPRSNLSSKSTPRKQIEQYSSEDDIYAEDSEGAKTPVSARSSSAKDLLSGPNQKSARSRSASPVQMSLVAQDATNLQLRDELQNLRKENLALMEERKNNLQSLERMKTLIKSQEAKIELYTERLKESSEREEAAKTDYSELEGRFTKSLAKVEELNKKLNVIQSQFQQNQKEMDLFNRDKKHAEVERQNRESKLNKALEEVDKFKEALRQTKVAESNSHSNILQASEKLALENKKLERQKAELLSAFQKQMKLIDVLKRQKIHLEAARKLAFTEEEFNKILSL